MFRCAPIHSPDLHVHTLHAFPYTQTTHIPPASAHTSHSYNARTLHIQIHTVVGAGAAGGAMDAGNLLKPMLGRGELRCIGEGGGGWGELRCIGKDRGGGEGDRAAIARGSSASYSH